MSYNLNSLNFSNFLFERINETINYCQYIKEVTIDYFLTESFGNEYIRVTYHVYVNDDFHELPKDVKRAMFIGPSQFPFTLSTHAESRGRNDKRKLLRIIEFKNIYETLASYVCLQLEDALNPETSIKIKGIDLWPEVNYAEKYLNKALYFKHKRDRGSSFEHEVLQWDRLHRLANDSKKIYAKEKAYFSITDLEIDDLFDFGFDEIRFLLLRYEIPIKTKGIKTINKIHIHTLALVDALKKEIKHEYFYGNKFSISILD